ncbi:hypothetical protein O181_063279 [Austropuccinia psidii MF-1]|uniref:Uncharacterized protein n=1 Tax=Austropuccinia psidii MF-1 TaxID=1389203 RepID=A0A9Q3EM43_9BASI|nr:hypothetical protein [Austropuccinia psidii MF-1]
MEDIHTPSQKHTISIPPLQWGQSAARLTDPFSDHKQMTNPTERHDNQYCLRKMIAQANAAIKEDMKLKEDGSNFDTWEENMAMLLDNYLSTADGMNAFDERICLSLLIHLVLDTICKKIIKLRLCSAIYSYLKNHYHILTRASQVRTWKELLSTQMKDGESTTALVDRVLTKVRSYENTNSKLNEDYILGLLLQQSTISGILPNLGTNNDETSSHKHSIK